ncbi:Cadherin-like protein [anaerobic digester metagenome]
MLGFTPSASIDEGGTIYYVVVVSGDTAPTASQIKNGKNASNSDALASSSSAVSSDPYTSSFTAITGLSSNTNYDVYFVAEDDESTPNIQASVTKIVVTTDIAQVPTMLTNEGLTLNEGATASIPLDTLEADDADTDNSTLLYTVTASLANGQLENTDNPGVSISSFTQQNLIDGKIQYVHDGTNTTSDSFTFKVSDGTNELTGQTFSISVNAVDDDTPTVSKNKGLSLDEGATATIDLNLLECNDTDSDNATLMYTLTASLSNGQLENTDNPGISITSFTQKNLMDEKICYVHDGTDTTSDSFTFKVSDGTNELTGQTFSITIAPADVEITGFDAISNVSAGTAGSATYANAAAVIAALPTTATANTSAVTVPVSTWVDTDSYNTAVAGSYTFTATLGTIPSGYANTGSYTATVEVVVSAPSNDATLKTSSIVKGQVVTNLGTPNATLGSETAGAVTITAAKAADTSNVGSFITLFDKNDANATVKVVKYVSGASMEKFGTDTAYANQTLRTGDFFIVKVTAEDATTVNYYKVNVTVTSASSGSSGGGGGSSSTTTQPSQNTVVVVNGKEQNAGKETQTTENGKSTVTITVDNKVVESKIDEAIKTNTAGIGNVVQVPVADTKSDVVKVELTGDIVKKLEVNAFDVSVKRDSIEYVIPAAEFTIRKVAENLGIQEKALADIKVEVQITKLDKKVVEKYNEVAKANGAELVFPPVEFEIVAKTTTTDGTAKEQSINKFSNYVERVMEIPAGVDPDKITTGIVFNADGTYSHVPTEVYQKDGKWYAKLNSMTNSDYSVIWNPVTVKSVENHWAKDAVNDMASRLVIFNPEEFEPNKAITRADFAEYIVRALGLYREGSTHENNFKDVSAKGERTLAILIANEYGIVSGYSDGNFRGDNQITREEAMVMYQRAMEITKLVGSDENRYQSYTDYSQVSDWAKTNVKNVLSAHVFNGTTATKISPKGNLTYAEAAQAIRNLLIESKLISE